MIRSGGGIDFALCIALKSSFDTPWVNWTVKFLRHLLAIAKAEAKPVPIIVFAHSQGAIYIEHALELLHPEERELLRIFTFGGGTFILPGKSHPESHNYASAADHVCLGSSLNDQSLALKRYYGLRAGHTEQQVINQLAYDDTILCLDSIDPQTISLHRELYVKYYKKEFARIRHITILDPDPGNRWKHEFVSECYQSTVRDIIRIYQKL